MPKVVYYKDDSEQHLWRYRVVADNHEIVHASHRGWDRIDDAFINLWAVKEALATVQPAFRSPPVPKKDEDQIVIQQLGVLFTVLKTDTWRWQLGITMWDGSKMPSGLDICAHVSHAHEGFVNRIDCIHNASLVHDIIAREHDKIVE